MRSEQLRGKADYNADAVLKLFIVHFMKDWRYKDYAH